MKRCGGAWALLTVLAISWALVALAGGDPNATDRGYFERSTAKPYAAVIADAEYAIADHNFRITGRNTVGAAIAERDKIDFPQHTVLQFCNLEFARRLLQADSNYVRYMPCHLYVYERDGKVVIGTPQLPAAHPAAREVNATLQAIVNYASE